MTTTLGAGTVPALPDARTDRSTDTVTLVCLHHAGGSSAVFHGWQQAMPPGYAVHAVQLPGRDARSAEPGHHRLEPLVDQLDDELDELLRRPHVIFGHSMGALLGYRLLQRRAARGARPAEAFLAAAYAAPHLDRSLPGTDGRPRGTVSGDLDRIDDLALARRLHAIGGMPAELLRRPEWLRPLLGTVRDDLRVCADHRPQPLPPLQVPLHVFGGTDDPLVDEAGLMAWSEHAGVGFGATLLDGGHFLVQERSAGLLDRVRFQLEALAHVRALGPVPLPDVTVRPAPDAVPVLDAARAPVAVHTSAPPDTPTGPVSSAA